MAHELRLELSDAAFKRLDALKRQFHEPNAEALVFRALGLLQTIQEYVGEDGVLTVVDPALAADAEDDPHVELVFENFQGGALRLPDHRTT
jgi:hypothetical protein